jgi:glutaminyl-peptide cyclotransferase
MRLNYIARVVVLPFVLISCGEKKNTASESPVDSMAITYTVLKTLPHNTDAYTQGLTIHNSKLYESTGQNGKSWVAEVDPGSGNHDKKIILDNSYFGEGMTILNNKLYYLTWRTKIGFIYDARTFKQIGEFNYNTEGWGLTHNNKDLIMSDGTEKIYFLDSAKLAVTRTITVTDNGARVKSLNELEWVNGYIFANVYETSRIVKIDPSTGKVVGRLDLSTIVEEIKRMYQNTAELNGIAYDKNSNALLVTGKLWPKSYLIRLQQPGT